MKIKKIIFALSLFSIVTVTAQVEKVQNWTSYMQSFDVSAYEGQEFRVSVAIRKEFRLLNDNWASLWVRIDKNDKLNGFFKNDAGGEIVPDTWKRYQIVGLVDKNASTLNFGALCMGNGKFFFDDFIVEINNKNGEWETIDVKNSGFEKDTEDSKINPWSEGIRPYVPFKVKGYTISFSEENPYKGKRALLIEGIDILTDD